MSWFAETFHWNYLLNRTGLLTHEIGIAAVVRGISQVFLIGGVLLGGWVLWQMMSQKRNQWDDWGREILPPPS